MSKATQEQFKEWISKIFATKIGNISKNESDEVWYDYFGNINKKDVALSIRIHKGQFNAGMLTKVLDQLENSKFKALILVSYSGYYETAYDYLENHQISNVYLYQYNEIEKNIVLAWSKSSKRVNVNTKQVRDIPKQTRPKRAKKAKRINIGIFTSKGGVGKTTISAHLAGALSIMGYDTALIDLDPQSNLKRLIGNGGIYIKNDSNQVGATLNVLNAKDWNESAYKEIKAVICDCNPELDKNPAIFVRKFDFCIIPITLNPLGLSKHAAVVERTVEAIRKKNTNVQFFILINQFEPKEGKKNKILLELLKYEVNRLRGIYENIELIDPNEISIRQSAQLFYWGMHTLTNENQSELAFEKVGSRSNPKDDFFKLAEYVANFASLT